MLIYISLTLTLCISFSTLNIICLAAFASKDTAVSNGILTAKGGIQPLETAVHSTHIHLAEPAGALVSTTEDGVTNKILGCITLKDVGALKFGSLAVPGTLRTESGDIHALQVHDWEEREDGVINIIDPSGTPYVIKSDPSCSSVIKHGRRLYNYNVDNNVDWGALDWSLYTGAGGESEIEKARQEQAENHEFHSSTWLMIQRER